MNLIFKKAFVHSFGFLILLSSSGYSQKAIIKEIKRKPNPAIFKTQYPTIFYPIIVVVDSTVAKHINETIRAEILGSGEKGGSLRKDLNDLIEEGLIDMSYLITYNKNNFLSLNISTQKEEFHHLYRSTSYFNFELKTGKDIHITDVIDEREMDSLKKKVLQDKIRFLNSYIADSLQTYLSSRNKDSGIYKHIIEEVDSGCVNAIQLETFSLTNSYFEIIDPCVFFSDAMKGLQPDYDLKYSYEYIRPFLKLKFKDRFLK